jgi:hypothetical protein
MSEKPGDAENEAPPSIDAAALSEATTLEEIEASTEIPAMTETHFRVEFESDNKARILKEIMESRRRRSDGD